MTNHCKCKHPKVNINISLSYCINCKRQVKMTPFKNRSNKRKKA